MDKSVFQPSLSKRKSLLSIISKQDSSWKFRMFLTFLLFSISICILIATTVLLILHPTNTMGVFTLICSAIIMACVPFFIALSTKNKAKFKCAYPYSSYANGTLILDGDNLQYIFWQVGPTEPAAYSSPRAVYRDENKFVYKIDKKFISKLIIDENGICTIFGNGKIIVPDWADIPKKEINSLSKKFSFVLAFDEKDVNERIINWKNDNG